MDIAPSASNSIPPWFLAFFIGWIGLGIAGFFLFYVSKNAAFKRRFFPWYIIIVGLIFAAIPVASGQTAALFMVIPAVALISFMNIRLTKFCDACGRTVVSHAFFS